MNWKDELCSVVTNLARAYAHTQFDGTDEGDAFKTTIEAFDAWFASHELVDLTTCGPQCPAWRVMVGAPRCIATFRTLTVEEDPDYDARIDNAPIGQPCPVMAARREAT